MNIEGFKKVFTWKNVFEGLRVIRIKKKIKTVFKVLNLN